MALPEEYLLSPEEREKRRLAANKPQIRVAFGNKGLTGVEQPSRGFESPSRALRDPEASRGFEADTIGGMPDTAVKLPFGYPTGAQQRAFRARLQSGGFGRPAGPDEGPSLTVPPPSPIPEGFKLPDEMTHPVLQAPKPNLTGMSPIDRSVAVLDAQREAADQFPSSKVTPEGEILPPKMHHGFKDRLKSIGKGALIGFGSGGVGGALAGAITGGVSPITIDKVMAQRALQRKSAEVDQQMEIEARRAQLDKLRHPELQKPVYETRADEQGNEIRQQWNPRTGKLEDVIGPDGQPVVVKRAKAGKEEGDREVGGRVLRKQPDGSYQVVYEPPEKPEKPDRVDIRQGAERQRKYDAGRRELASLIEGEKEAEKQKNTAYAEYGNLQAQYSRQVDEGARTALKPQLDAAKDRAEKAQAYYASFGEKKTKAQKDIDENAPGAEPDPKVKAYADQFFGGDVDAAQKAIDAQRASKSGVGRIR